MDNKFEDLKDDLMNFKLEVKEFTAGLKQWQSETTQYRIDLCRKLDSITNKLTELPCKERKGFYVNVSNQLKVIWGVIVLIVGAIISEWVRRK